MTDDDYSRACSPDRPADEYAVVIGQCLRQVLGSPPFVAAPVLSRLLDYLGRAAQTQGDRRVTAYRIALDVFGQAPDFDPQTNSLVRANMVRLRRLLERHYVGEGAAAPWRLVLPRGHYALQLAPGAMSEGAERAGKQGAPGEAPYQPSLAVLPVENLDGDADWQFFCNGMTVELIHLLTRSRNLRVVAPQTMLKLRDADKGALEVARELKADYALICGASCRDGSIRFTAQLAEAVPGRRLWSEQYRRSLTAGGLHALQEEIAAHVVGLIVSPHGLIERLARHRPPGEISSYYAVLRFYEYQEALSPQTHARARALLEQAVRATPGYAEAWACLGITYGGEEFFGFNRRADAAPPIERALAAARRALQIDSHCLTGLHCLALCHAYRREKAQFQDAADRILALAPSRADLLASLGLHIAYAGEWTRGLGMLDRARSINPLHPSWYWFPYALDAYRRGDHEAALCHAHRLNMPQFFWDPLFVAMTCGQLGRQQEAGEALGRMLALNPALQADPASAIGAVIPDPELIALCIDGLRKAGLGAGPPPGPDR